jgi:hypothetical protein
MQLTYYECSVQLLQLYNFVQFTIFIQYKKFEPFGFESCAPHIIFRNSAFRTPLKILNFDS